MAVLPPAIGARAQYGCGMAELLHITERAAWHAALQAGEYRMSTRGVTLDEQGFIHCSLRHQLRGVAEFPTAAAATSQPETWSYLSSTASVCPPACDSRPRSPVPQGSRTSTARSRSAR
jgi:Protein of unknown function (DUF952)